MNYNRGLPRGEEESPPWHVHPGYYSPSRVAIPGVLSVSLREKHEARLEQLTENYHERKKDRGNGDATIYRGLLGVRGGRARE